MLAAIAIMTVFILSDIDRPYGNSKVAPSDKVPTRIALADEVPMLIRLQMLDAQGIQTATGYGKDTTKIGEVKTRTVRTLVLEGK